jgi:ATP-binding cassette subfamily B protein
MRAAFRLDPYWRKYVQALRQEKAALFTALVSAVGKSLATTGFALAVREILQTITEHAQVPVGAAWVAVAMAVLAAGFGLGNRYSVIWLVQSITHGLRRAAVAKLMVLGPGTVAKLGRANLLSVAVQDSERVDRMTTSLVGGIIPSIFLVVGYVLALLIIVPMFGAIAIGLGVVFWICNHLMNGKITFQADQYAAAFARLSQGILLTIERLGIVRAGGLSAVEMAERERDLRSLRKMAISTDQVIGTVSESAALMGNLATLALIVAAAAFSTSGLVMADIMTGYLLLLMIRSQVAGTGATMPDLKIGMAAFTRIQHLLDTPDERPYSGTRKIAFKGNLQLTDVSFGFGDRMLLSGLNLVLKQGSTVAITGPNGSGKTTILNLVLGIYRPRTGGLFAEGLPFEELDIPGLLGSVGYVPQEPVIFADTILQNISYGQPNATLQQVEHAARLAGADAFITQLPAGYFTPVGDQGALLSGGQKQRVALARALLGHHSLLILDEPTNHLDHLAVSALLKTLTEREDSPAVLIITHDEALLEVADQVFELRDGALSKPGTVLTFDAASPRGPATRSLHS